MVAAFASTSAVPYAHTVLIEAEAFDNPGGWVLDQQFMDQMGSPYLLAHGLGAPVEDATTAVEFPATGGYHVWARTRDWVAPWNAPGLANAATAPGKFLLVVDGKPLETVFGTEGAEWHWQDGGIVEIEKRKVPIALHDLTGFEGRCEAIIFSSAPDFTPPNEREALEVFRRKALGLPEEPDDAGEFDLVVVGGGIAGTCAALSAARLGLRVAFIQDRPVLGGNNSSEVRVWLGGETNYAPYPRIGDVVKELDQERRGHPGPAEIYEDERKESLVETEKNISLFLNCRANAVETESGRIQAVAARHVGTGRRLRFRGGCFADCTGDGAIGFLAGADHEMTPTGHMGPSNLWSVVDTGKPSPFPRCPWAVDLSDKPFPGREGHASGYGAGLASLGKWYWESGFNRDPIEDAELIRDANLRAMYGAWDCLKNVDCQYPNHRIEWAAYIAGKRESRRLLGDVVLTREDIESGKKHPDGCVPTSWSIDLHLPDKRYVKGFESDPFISKADFGEYKRPYWVPYRCLYSRNVENLFMAGRDISVTHEALGAVRVMRTTGMMGEIVGMAAAICKKHGATPRGVYENHLDELKHLMKRGIGKLPAPAFRTERGPDPRPEDPS